MRIKRSLFLLLLCSLALLADPAMADDPKTITEKVKDMEAHKGYFDFYWDKKEGKIWLKVDKLDQEFLFLNWLAAGLGSNDVGLDRGQGGDNRVVKFVRVGPKVLLQQPNYTYRAISDNADERASVEQAFASSILWGFKVEAEDDKAVLIDLTDFLLHDWHGVSQRLKALGEGSYSVDASRSAVYTPMCKNFPENTELEATVTFKGQATGAQVPTVTPSSEAITLRLHHSFVKLPDDQYKPRTFDPRGGFWPLEVYDYASPIESSLIKRYIYRHRLEKKDPSAAMSEAVEPIIYYVDRGAPEPIRSALIEGASWWNQAFEAAGYKDAFQVKVLPADADPLDVRYNLIQWVHRSTRGWSYGNPIVDPRTGEIIKGHVSLGSLRVRQDFLIATGLLSPFEADGSMPETMTEMALARLRQLSAHEVGHTLGIAHNFAASTIDRASVMDYPQPYITISGDSLDFSQAYDTGIGAWDKVTIAFGYQDFPEGKDEDSELRAMLSKAFAEGMRFISDADARPRGSAHPDAHLWDNGKNAADELRRMLAVRELALKNFSEKAIRPGEPMSNMEEVLAPIYFFHRYQLEACSKVIGGLRYNYGIRGDGQAAPQIVSAEAQKKALEAMLESIKPERLSLSEDILKLLPPKAYGYDRGRESFKSRTGLTFDAVSAAETAASMTFSLLLHPQRCARIVEQQGRNSSQQNFSDYLKTIREAVWDGNESKGIAAVVKERIQTVQVLSLMQLATNSQTSPEVSSRTITELRAISNLISLKAKGTKNASESHLRYISDLIDLFLKSKNFPEPPAALSAPDGSPIGMGCDW